MAFTPTDSVTVNSVSYRLRQDQNGVRQFRSQRVPYDPETVRAFYEAIPITGSYGMGASVLAAGNNQNHYGLDVIQHIFDQATLGYEQNSITLSLTNVTQITEVARDTSDNYYVYIGNDSAVLPKIRLDTMAAISTPKTFSHGGGSEKIVDVIVAKTGLAPGITDRTVTQQGNGLVLCSFGSTAPLSQVNTISANATDTWVNTANSSYGGFLAKVQGNTSTDARIWKTIAQSGAANQTGVYTRLQYIALSASSLDYSDNTQWNPSTPYQVGEFGTSITGLTEFNRGLVVGKPEGVYEFDASFSSRPLLTTRSYRWDGNARNLTSWLNTLLVPTRKDLMTPSGVVGISKLLSNTSPIQGYPTAVCTWGDYAFVAYYDGTDTYILMMRQRDGESVKAPMLFWGVTKLASKTCYAMRVVTRANGDTILIYGKGGDLGWCILDPSGSRKYATSGFIISPRFGSPGATRVIESISTYVAGAGANVNITPSIDVDESGSFTSYTAYTSAGRKTTTLTPGTGDTGTFFRFKMTWSTNSNTATATLYGGDEKGGGGVIYVRGTNLGATYEQFQMEILAGTSTAGVIGTDRATQKAALVALINTVTTIVYSPHFGDTSTHAITITNVEEREGPGDAPQSSEAYFLVTFKTLAGTT